MVVLSCWKQTGTGAAWAARGEKTAVVCQTTRGQKQQVWWGNAQAWREDRTLIAAADCIADALGQRYVESVPLNMEHAWAESTPRIPLICLLSPGALPYHKPSWGGEPVF